MLGFQVLLGVVFCVIFFGIAVYAGYGLFQGVFRGRAVGRGRLVALTNPVGRGVYVVFSLVLFVVVLLLGVGQVVHTVSLREVTASCTVESVVFHQVRNPYWGVGTAQCGVLRWVDEVRPGLVVGRDYRLMYTRAANLFAGDSETLVKFVAVG